MLKGFFRWGGLIKNYVLTLWFACADPKTPGWIKLLAVAGVLYLFSPIDLIPDVIPVLGQLDDLVVITLLSRLLLFFLPADIRLKSEQKALYQRGKGKKMAGISGLLLLLLLLWLGLICYATR